MNEEKRFITGANIIAAERYRQIRDEGRSREDDTKYPEGSLGTFALFYTNIACASPKVREQLRQNAVDSPAWPMAIHAGAWKPGADDSYTSRLRELAKAGALIAAQMDVFIPLAEAEEREVRRPAFDE